MEKRQKNDRKGRKTIEKRQKNGRKKAEKNAEKRQKNDRKKAEKWQKKLRNYLQLPKLQPLKTSFL